MPSPLQKTALVSAASFALGVAAAFGAFSLVASSLRASAVRRGGSAAVPAGPARVAVAEQVVVTNVVAVTEVVTNTVTVTNEVAAVPPPRVLSRRKTAPYTVVCGVMRPEELRGSVSKAGARAISALPASVALVEANDRAVSALRDDGVFRVEELRAADKIARGVLPLRAGAEPSAEGTVSVKISPLSAIDVGEISSAVAALGGEAKEDFEEGRPVVRATLSEKAVVELARRGDVLRIDGGVR